MGKKFPFHLLFKVVNYHLGTQFGSLLDVFTTFPEGICP